MLLYTSELKEIQLVCDRSIVIFGGRVVAEIAAAEADEPALLRAAYNLQADAQMPEVVAAEVVAAAAAEETTGHGDVYPAEATEPSTDSAAGPDGRESGAGSGDALVTAAPQTIGGERTSIVDAVASAVRRNTWTVALVGLLIGFLVLTKLIQPNYAAPGIQGLAISVPADRLRRRRPGHRRDLRRLSTCPSARSWP